MLLLKLNTLRLVCLHKRTSYSQSRQLITLMMSARGKIDSYFSPKTRAVDAKRPRPVCSANEGEDESSLAQVNKRAKPTQDALVGKVISQSNDTIKVHNKESQDDNSNEKDKKPLSPEQKQMIENRRLVALEKLQQKSDSIVDKVYMGESWKNALAAEFKKDYYTKLKKFIDAQRKVKTIYPSEKDVFTWSQLCSIQEVKVVIIGQDPYHGPNQAHGLCFSVPVGVPAPPSLQNIYKELKTDIRGFEIPDHGYLIGWAKQGVLLLNAVLTVEARNANSHQGKGWEHFTDAVIKWINHNSSNVVFLLWGAYAQKKGASIDKKRHCVLKGPHPSPLSAHRGFFGCKHFSEANKYLVKNDKTPIDWKFLPRQL